MTPSRKIKDPFWTALVGWEDGTTEEIDTENAESWSEVRPEIKKILAANYEPGGTIIEIQIRHPIRISGV